MALCFLGNISQLLLLTVLEIVIGKHYLEGKVCYGTFNELSRTGSEDHHYNMTRLKYEGCTFVQGNLEITWIERATSSNMDLSFLENIEVVTGYVLIAAVQSDVIPLTKLRHVRGEHLYNFKGSNFAFVVLLSENKNGIQMPEIEEINGNVLFAEGSVCYSSTVAWHVFTKGSVSHVYLKNEACGECDAACTNHKGRRYCWGPGPNLCQTVTEKIECNWFCQNGTCFDEGVLGCCHPECLGCDDHWIATGCKFCRHYKYNGRCVAECPEDTYAYGEKCYRNHGNSDFTGEYNENFR